MGEPNRFASSRMSGGRQLAPQSLLIMGRPGSGKTQLACGATAPLVVDDNSNGSFTHGVTYRIAGTDRPKTFAEWLDFFAYLPEDTGYREQVKTLVIENLPEIQASAIYPAALESYQPAKGDSRPASLEAIPFNGGPPLAMPYWTAWLERLSALQRQTNWDVILTGITVGKKAVQLGGNDFYIEDIAIGAGDRGNSAELIRGWATCVLYTHVEDFGRRDDSRDTRSRLKAISQGDRVVIASHLGWVRCKNRIGLPGVIPNNDPGSNGLFWQTYQKCLRRLYSLDPDELRRICDEIAEEIFALVPNGAEARGKYAERLRGCGDSVDSLQKYYQGLNGRLEELKNKAG